MAARDSGIKQRRALGENSRGIPASLPVGQGESNAQVYDRIVKEHRKERAKMVLWRKPLLTLFYFARELVDELHTLSHSILQHRIKVLLVFVMCVVMVASYCIDGPHQQVVLSVEKQLIWCGYWIGLGILSSVGLGTGLHTFLLYLGPHIASVTMAAWTCDSVDFPQPPYPQDIVCPSEAAPYQVTMWTIMSKVRLEAMMWGLGTAIGELPPYFMARAARQSGTEEEVEELEEVLHSEKKDPLTRAKKIVHVVVQKVGFFGILLCASIPNPLFDLAGITCGHFQIPFWTFFGATVIGKAVIKMHIQKLFVILAFSKVYVEWVVEHIGTLPYIGQYIKVPFSDYLEKQRKKLHRKPGSDIALSDSSLLQWIFGQILLIMVVYFVISIINSMAQNFVKKRDEQTLKQLFPTTPSRELQKDL